MKDSYIVGVDLGGTKIATALCDGSGNIITKVKIDTDAVEGEEKVVGRMIDSIHQVIRNAGVSIREVSGIGVGAPGPLSISQGMIIHVASAGWRNMPVRNLIQREFNIPVYLENDANAAAYAEAYSGAGQGCGNLVYITMSTGVGCGIITGGKILHGRHDAAGELGHICVRHGGRRCSCGNRGCLQAYASGTSIAQIAREHAAVHKDSRILQLAGMNPEQIDCLTVENAAREGDYHARKIWHHAGVYLGLGISIILQMLDTDIVVIGGGASKAWSLFCTSMVRTVKRHIYRQFAHDINIVPAKLGDDAGVLGAAMVALSGEVEGKGLIPQQ